MPQQPPPAAAIGSQDFETRAAGAAMFLLRTTLLGTLVAFVAVLAFSTWRVFNG